MLRSTILVLALTATSVAQATPVEVAAGQRYPEGTEVSFGAIGVVIQIPPKWIGAMAPNGEAFLLVSSTEPGLVAATAEPGQDLATTLAELNEPLPIEDLVLKPDGPAKKAPRGARQRYSGGTAEKPFVGLARVIIDRGVAVGFVALGPKSAEKKYKRLLEQLIAKTRFVAKTQPKRPSGGAWQQKLSGYALEYLHTSGGLSSTHTIRLCPSGNYQQSGGDSYMSGGFSAVGSNGGAGRWTINGDVLTLVSNNGRKATYRLTTDGSKTFLNGTRYFVANPAGCN